MEEVLVKDHPVQSMEQEKKLSRHVLLKIFSIY